MDNKHYSYCIIVIAHMLITIIVYTFFTGAPFHIQKFSFAIRVYSLIQFRDRNLELKNKVRRRNR